MRRNRTLNSSALKAAQGPSAAARQAASSRAAATRDILASCSTDEPIAAVQARLRGPQALFERLSRWACPLPPPGNAEVQRQGQTAAMRHSLACMGRGRRWRRRHSAVPARSAALEHPSVAAGRGQHLTILSGRTASSALAHRQRPGCASGDGRRCRWTARPPGGPAKLRSPSIAAVGPLWSCSGTPAVLAAERRETSRRGAEPGRGTHAGLPLHAAQRLLPVHPYPGASQPIVCPYPSAGAWRGRQRCHESWCQFREARVWIGRYVGSIY